MNFNLFAVLLFKVSRATKLLSVLLLLLPAAVQAQDAYSTNADGSIYTYSTNADGSANIVAYAGPPWVVTIPTNINSLTVTTIGDLGPMTSVTIPDSVTNIVTGAFVNVLTAITVDTNNPAYSSLNGVLFDKSQTTLIQYPFGLVGSYEIPSSVTTIGGAAFYGHGQFGYSNLTSVKIPSSVTSIGNDAFLECYGLTNITILDGVTSIGYGAFEACTRLTSVTVPASVTSIGQYAFYWCKGLTSVYFTGNAPSPTNDSTVFFGGNFPYVFYDPATVYYLPGTTGWGALFDSLPTAPWFLPNPQILNQSASFGVQPGGFGFTISWATNASVVVEAATNLANPVWFPVSTNTLTGGTNYFSDPQWTNYPMRFYRAAGAFTVGGTLTGLPAGDTVTLQDNGSDDLTLSANGTFTFPTALPNGHAYSITVSGTSVPPPTTCTLTNGSGNISGANVTNVAIQCMTGAEACPALTGNMDEDMYNAAVSDGTAHGGVPAVMFTTLGGPFRVTAGGTCSENVALTYDHWAWIDITVGSNSCSSTSFPSGTRVIVFGSEVECGGVSYTY
jgi:hypothetical protein